MNKLIIRTYKDKYGRNRKVTQYKNKVMPHLGFGLRKAKSRGWYITRYKLPIFFAYTLKDIDFYISKDHDVTVIAELMMLYYKAKGNITNAQYKNSKIEINKNDLLMDFEDLAIYADADINKESA